jgi:hypothetical protein
MPIAATSRATAPNVSLQNGAHVVHNQASTNGGGLYNTCGSGYLTAGALFLLNSPNNIFNDPGCLFD